MQEIKISAVPRQSFSIQLDSRQYDFLITAQNNFMTVTLSRDNVLLLSGMIIVAGTPVIPFRYMESGNFALITLNEEMPFYTQFGTTQTLLYVSAAEIGALRAGT